MIDSTLFKNFTNEELNTYIQKSQSYKENYKKGSYIFNQGDRPEYLYILLSGAVQVEKIDYHGNKTIVNIFTEDGTVFGEVYLFLEDSRYDYGCKSIEDSMILKIPKSNILMDKSEFNDRLKNNMLHILSEKAHYLNKKLLISSARNLRQKISTYLIQNAEQSDKVQLPFNREELANYIGTTRPSLSRELGSMEDDGLITVEKDMIIIDNLDDLVKLS